MVRSKAGLAMANIVMETISDLQRKGLRSRMKEIKNRIVERYGKTSEKFMKMVPTYVNRGLNLGLVTKYKDNYRTKMYMARRRRGRVGKRRRRRRSRRRR